jgi:hypothetical protein
VDYVKVNRCGLEPEGNDQGEMSETAGLSPMRRFMLEDPEEQPWNAIYEVGVVKDFQEDGDLCHGAVKTDGSVRSDMTEYGSVDGDEKEQ